MEYYIQSGKIVSYNQGISVNNRAFRYGDSLFETMFFTNNKISFFDKHIDRLKRGLETLRISFKELDTNLLLTLIKELVQINSIDNSARIRLQIFRKDGGFYLPENREFDYIIEAFPMGNSQYKLNKKGIKIGIAKDLVKNKDQFSQIKTTSKIEMILCAMEAEDNAWDDAIILNNNGNLVESSKSNLFIYKNNTLYTPSLDDGPLNGIMRQNILQIGKDLNINCIETQLTETDILNADEVFLTNAIIGINWVSAFKTKRYMHKISNTLIDKLNTTL